MTRPSSLIVRISTEYGSGRTHDGRSTGKQWMPELLCQTQPVGLGVATVGVQLVPLISEPSRLTANASPTKLPVGPEISSSSLSTHFVPIRIPVACSSQPTMT